MKPTLLSVIVPVYNEEACIETTLTELAGVLEGQEYAWEIVAIDDGSTDGTVAILDRLQRGRSGLKVVRLKRNAGQSAAMGVGFKRAGGDVLVNMDADGQNDPADIPRLVAELDACDCCCGFRASRKDTFSKRMGSRFANAVRNRALGEAIIDTGCTLKAFRAELVRDVVMWKGMHRFLPSLFSMQGAVIRQVPVNHRHRSAGKSKYTNWGRLKQTIWDLWAVRWMKKRTVRVEVEGDS